MSFATARRDIEGRLKSNWATTPIAFDNIPYKPRDGVSWIRCQIFEDDVRRLNIGGPGHHRVIGLIVLSIYVPVNSGTQTAREYGDSLAEIFRDQQFNGITCREAVPATIGEVSVKGMESGWYQYDINVRFQWVGIHAI